MSDFPARQGLRSRQTFVAFGAAECDQPIHQRFEQQARRYANASAIRLQSGDVSYRELNAAANRAARMLRATAGDDSKPVALLTDQGYESIVWTLASLKAGICYAPLDQRLPESALRSIIKDLNPGRSVAAPQYCERVRGLAANDFAVIQSDANRDSFSSDNLDLLVRPDSVACIFYTSGSTGAPKGIADCHRNVLHNVLRYTNSLRFAPGDILSLVQNPSFSGTASSLFGALVNGATAAPFDLQGEGLQTISQWLRYAQVTVFHGVPSIFRQLADPLTKFPSVRLIRLEGDRATPLDVAHFQANFQDSCTLVNGLGATECGLVRQFFIGKDTLPDACAPLPIGYPVTDMTVRVVDEQGTEQPFGANGEIVVESRFLATGYWRNPALTAARFVALGDGLRRYRTGDLGRMSEDGCLVHLGRTDQRIRIGGEFVAAADLETMLLEAPGVSQVAVRDFVDQLGERRLCAYAVAVAAVTATALRQALSDRVAPQQLPSTFVFVDALPLTKDLKIDYARLPPPGRQRPRLANDYIAPRTEVEQQMARIWSAVLEIEEVGVTDSFFDLGGDSLRAARFVTLFKEQQGQAIQVIRLFEYRTIRALARFFDYEPPVSLENRAMDKEDGQRLPGHSIAIIGMAGRFPGADTINQFWDNLCAGKESLTFSDDVSDQNGSKLRERVTASGLLSDVDRFDAALFRLTPRQAQMLDPQQRLWLECVHQALEDAGLPVNEAGYAGAAADIGVFAGARESSYLWHLVGGNRAAVEALLHRSGDEAVQLMFSNDTDFLAARTSFVMGFTGPSINVQTACSTSLVAVAQACQALVSGQCDLAVAGGVAVSFPQRRDPTYQEGGIHSRDGHCRAFDAGATGTVFGDGAGVVVLKRFDDAIRDGDRIDALVRGWAVNNDGSNKASFAAPSVHGQAQVVARAQDHAKVRPQDVSYVEAHGTGTPVGDPIEFAALAHAFRRATSERRFCGLGSVKTNIGHLDAAAGIAGLIKTVLALKHHEIPPTLHFRKANPEIDFGASPFYVIDRLSPWPNDEGYRIAGVSSFGIGGTNCHVVLQEAPVAIADEVQNPSPAYLLTLSAASAAALAELEDRYRRFLAQSPIPDLAGIAATTQKSRSQYSYRTAIVGKSAEQMRSGLSQSRAAGAVDSCWRGKAQAAGAPEIGFLFAGQGSQYATMGRELYRVSPEFRRQLDLCDRILRDELERPLLDVMFDGAGDLIHRTEYAQPALIALEYSLAELLRSWGIVPKFVMGHSIGEYAAACSAGVFTLEEGLRLAAARGRLMQRLPGRGKMLAVTAEKRDLDRVLQRFPGRVSIAALNSPTQTVLAGAADAIDQLKTAFQAQAIYCRELAVSHAFHSAQMDPALAPLRDLIGNIDLRVPTQRLFSNLHGRAVTTEVTKPDYWCDQARQPVQFAAGFRAMIDAGCEVFVEIGPDAVFSFLSQEFSSKQTVETIPTLRCGESDWTALLATLARLYVRGVPVNWAAFQKGQNFKPVRLPNYPLQRSRHWYEGPLVKSQRRAATASQGSAGHPLLGRRLRLPGSTEIRFESRFSQSTPHYLDDHRLFGVSLPPAASHFAMLAQATEFLGGGKGDSYRFEDLYLLRPLLLQDGCEREVQLIFKPEAQGWSLELTSTAVSEAESTSGEWTLHMIGLGRRLAAENLPPAAQAMDLGAIKARCARELSGNEFYSKIWANQGGTGSAFRWIESIWQGDREALCRAACPASVADAANYRLHPGLIEAACQVLHGCAVIETEKNLQQQGTTFVPFSVDLFSLFDVKAAHEQAWCYAQLREHGDNNVLADLSILNAGGEIVAQLAGFRLRPITQQAIGASTHRETTRPERQPQARLQSGQVADFDKAAPSVQQIMRYLQSQCAELSGYPESEIRTDQGFMAMGLDSMVAMNLSNRIRLDFGCAVPVTQILMSTSIASLAQIICRSVAD